jgi:hypothetical protein
MATHLVAPDATDHAIAALARERIEQELRERINAAMNRQLALFLAAERSRGALAEAA